jgi:predicted transposase YbfD/YdcC
MKNFIKSQQSCKISPRKLMGEMAMSELITILEKTRDTRQEWKVLHKLSEVVLIVLLALLANADEWELIEDFAYANEETLREYMTLENGIPSHDTIQRVMSIIDPKEMQRIQLAWNEIMNGEEGKKLKKILNIDGKTMRGTASAKKKALHVVSAYSHTDGISFGQVVVDDKENEIVAIPDLLDEICIKDTIVTIDAMGCQTDIAKKIVKNKADYVLALKGNQGNLHKDVIDYFGDSGFRQQIKQEGNYHKTVEKAHGQIEVREYYQTADIEWLPDRKKWQGLASIGMVETTIEKPDGSKAKETRYFISSLAVTVVLFARAVREHWAIESMHWHLDVTFREDSNKTLDTTSALNLNILRKLALSVLKLVDVGKKCSLKRKRYIICANFSTFIKKIMGL